MNSTQNSSLTVAGYEVFGLVTDRFRLDGGAMFGSVPKVLWSNKIPADDLNRIQLCTRILVLRSEDRLVLVDTGMGRKWSPKNQEIFAIENLASLEDSAAMFGSREVTDLILTHLHFDHGGGVSKKNADGTGFELCFPNARHYLQVENWERAKSPGPREKAAYLPENVEPLSTGRLQLTTDEEVVLPGVRVFTYGGHTAGMQGVLVGDGPGAVWFPTDLIPTAHHIQLPYIMGYDLCAERTLAEKTHCLARAADEKWWVVFEHDYETAMAKVERDDRGGFRLGALGDLPSWILRGVS